jgi:hypothetical protein
VADPLHGLAVHRHLVPNRLTGDCGHDAELLDDERGVEARATELLIPTPGGTIDVLFEVWGLVTPQGR